MSEADSPKLDGDFVPDGTPIYYVSGLRLAEGANNVVITTGAPVTGHTSRGEPAVASKDMCSLVLDWQTMKDLQLLINRAIETRESEFGGIETDFSRRHSKTDG